MSDAERAAFTNLVLMCKPHHDLIDRIDPGRFSVSLLHQWKKNREGDDTSALNGLNGLTETRLAELLESSFRANAPQREVTIELSGAIFYDDGLNAISVTLAAWRNTLDINPQLPVTRQAILTTVRNVGSIPSSVEGFSIDLVFDDVDGQQQVCTLSGQDSFPELNPLLPKSLNVGAPAIRWLTSFDSLRAFLPALAGHGEIGIRATASLGSGETIVTDISPISLIPLDQ
ncbi:hypothetical protein [Kibdelosporangium aridum]|nr:hypothetical protein [Kibdelosporangium aridum]